MARLLFPLGLVTALLIFLFRTVSGLSLNDLFIVQSGSTDGGCDTHFNQAAESGTLDDWHTEITFALDLVVNRLDTYDQDIKVRRALQIFFGIRNNGKASAPARVEIDEIIGQFQRAKDFFDFRQIGGVPMYPLNGNRYLFCDSNFLIHQAEDTPAQDWNAQDIIDANGNIVTIGDVPGYAEALAENKTSEAWWSGDLTPVNGYYFSPTGGDYCDGAGLGLTAEITELNQPTRPTGIESIILCGSSFTNGKPNNYRDGDALIQAGTNLADVVPKSATLLHEALHVLNGAGPTGFLQGDEIYDIAACINAAKATKKRNPENYIFLVTHLYYLYGEPEDGNPGTSINTNWDFAVVGNGANRILGALTP
ncbi:hypothetical protein VE01_04980 [Pseudogymnoascus verrucosus]|uniref:Lysine-specific metallo-endopeptidase domain-containing protein n=1 Tax=Pseudogymnoascus verrucosus TaxID=342668 RepID=A0A1B8GPR6_9PEZI|nr:uncharacterized protein VE01_04980 [Pseudogymnoascus verrucosus]OBT97835.1 hypothetical protein VE01_04980 [Pseudogymnoascus verrucosus]